MKKQTLAKFVSAAILGVLVGWKISGDHEKDAALGRVAFLTKEAEWWDKYYAHPHPWAFYIFTWLIILTFVFATYELLAFCAYKVLTLLGGRNDKDKTS